MNSKLKRLDKVFSEYIRRRDADSNGYVRCISCGMIVHWKDADCGHYIPRANMSTRFDERNCNAQCRECNRAKDGNISGYEIGLVRKYGHTIIGVLLEEKWQIRKWSKHALDESIKYYRSQIMDMRNGKASKK